MLLRVREELALLRDMNWGLLRQEVILSARYHLAHQLLVDLTLIVVLVGLLHLPYADLEHLFHHV
jgi:hypothetical protein